MELKFFKAVERTPKLVCSNRTFMELKLERLCEENKIEIVLIVPLWNWNSVQFVSEYNEKDSSNRTFMELKSDKG